MKVNQVITESLADEFAAMARAKGMNVRVHGTPEQERERTQQMLAQRAADREKASADAAKADVDKLPELKAEYEAMRAEYKALGGSDWQYADREQNLTDYERKARSMEGPMNNLWRQIQAAEKAQGGVTEGSLEEVDRRGFLKGLGAAAVAGAANKAGAKGLWATIPVYTDSDPPLPRTVKMAWNYFSPDVLTQDDKNNIVKLINLLYFAKMAPEEWRDSQNGRIIGNVTPSQIYKKCHELLIFINDAFVNLDFGKVMNDQKSKIENLYKTDPEQFRKIQEFFFSKWETITMMGRLLQKKLSKDSNSEPQPQKQTTGPSDTYASRIVRRIKPNLVYQGEIEGNPRAEVEIRSAPDGTILSRRIAQSSGNIEWDKAVLRAIDKTAELPRDLDGTVPPVLLLGFRPNDLNDQEQKRRENLQRMQRMAGQETPMQEQGVAEGSMATKHVAPVKATPLSTERPKGEWDPIHGKAPKKGTVKYDIWRQKVSQDKKGVAEGDISQLEKAVADAPVEPIANMESKDDQKIGGRHDPDDFDAMVNRLKKLAGAGPLKTVYDPKTRRYKNMPAAVQPGDKK